MEGEQAVTGIVSSDEMQMQTLGKIILLMVIAFALSACGGLGALEFPGVYKIGIPQGNIITQEMINQLRPGMTKRQVIFVMGTPLVRDPYHQDRWDYVYNYQPGGGIRGQEKVTVFFVDDGLVRFTGDFNPTSEADS
jgi:outer membrane protein assembly factor BamE